MSWITGHCPTGHLQVCPPGGSSHLVCRTVGGRRLRDPITIPQRPPVPPGVPAGRGHCGHRPHIFFTSPSPRAANTNTLQGVSNARCGSSRNDGPENWGLRDTLAAPAATVVRYPRGYVTPLRPQPQRWSGTPEGTGGRCGMVIGILRRHRPTVGRTNTGQTARDDDPKLEKDMVGNELVTRPGRRLALGCFSCA